MFWCTYLPAQQKNSRILEQKENFQIVLVEKRQECQYI